MYKNREDQLACQRRWYKRNKESHKKRVYIRRKLQHYINRKFLFRVKRRFGCFDCGNKNPTVLEFDHNNKENKRMGIAQLVCGGHCLLTVKNEMRKCTIRCANCHRIRTAKQHNWKSLEWM